MPAKAAESVDLDAALAPDGTFVGAEGLDGPVDTNAWTLVSDLAAGEPPRFAAAAASPGVVDSAGNEWLGLGSNGAGNGALNSSVLVIRVNDLSVVVGGSFTNAAGIPEADFIATWNGQSWAALGSNGAGDGALNGPVRAILGSYIHGLIVGGDFTNAAGLPDADYIARWTGSDVWAALPPGHAADGVLNGPVHALEQLDSRLVVGGSFTDAAGISSADYVALWDGWNWSSLSGGGSAGALNGAVSALAVRDSDVYIGGAFTNAAGIAQADYIARWNDSGWFALGSNGAGNGALNGLVRAIGLSTGNLFVGGAFTNAAGIAQADYVARWNGSGWSALGSNGAGNGALDSEVHALFVWGTSVYVGGAFKDGAGIAQADYIARWNGSAWSALGSNGAGNGALGGEVRSIHVLNSAVYVGGSFLNAAGVASADHLALAITPGPWGALGSDGNGDGTIKEIVQALAVWKGHLYVGGSFTDAAGIPQADYIARWDGSSWSALGSNGAGNGALSNSAIAHVFTITPTSDALYVGGQFTDAGGVATADNLAIWNGTTWSGLASNGSANGALNGAVWDVAVAGNDVYAVGDFTDAGGVALADYVARWNGSKWSALGSSGGGYPALAYPVRHVAVMGGYVYIGGSFHYAGGLATAHRIARWNGSTWSAVGSDGSGGPALGNGSVFAMEVSGTNLYVGGTFVNAGGKAAADFVARWNGTTWSALGSNGAGNGALTGPVYALAVSGSDVYVGGSFANAAGITHADKVARWNGSAWSALGSNGAGEGVFNSHVLALAASNGALYAGGSFTNANGNPMADFVARYSSPSTYRPDGRIRKGSGALVGNNVYNADGTGQTRTGSAAIGKTVTFTISVQNDGARDRFGIRATGTSATGYRVRFFRGTTDVTAAVVAGSYQTPFLAAGTKFAIKARVAVVSGAPVGSSVTRLVTITSASSPSTVDVVKFIVKRK